MSTLSKLIYRFNEIPIKILSGFFFCGSWQVGSKIRMDSKDLECIKHLWKIKQLGEHTLPDFNVDYIKLHYQNMEASVWREENWSMIQKRKSTNRFTHICLIKFDNEAKAIQWKEDSKKMMLEKMDNHI